MLNTQYAALHPYAAPSVKLSGRKCLGAPVKVNSIMQPCINIRRSRRIHVRAGPTLNHKNCACAIFVA
jgi:hypothetical protein